MAEISGSRPQLPVEIEIWAGTLFYGSDDGFVTFEGGWIHFEGLRTSFSLEQSETSAIIKKRNQRGHYVPLAALCDYAFSAEIDGNKFDIALWPYESINSDGRDIEYPVNGLENEFSNWPRRGYFPRDNSPFYFPSTPHPEAFVKPWLLLGAMDLSIFGSGVGLVMTLWRGSYPFVPWCLVLALTIFIALRGAAVRSLDVLTRLFQHEKLKDSEINGIFGVTLTESLGYALRRSPRIPKFRN